MVFVTTEPLDSRPLSKTRRDPAIGAVVTFQGTVRGEERGEPIAAITYEAYEAMARCLLKEIVRRAEMRWPVRVAVAHRLGRVPVSEASLRVEAAGPHRQEAFEACQFVIDEIKRVAPIWKVDYEKARA
ncbi:MAG: hypothetical protein A2992_09300 [Elusimicrobia bacterium RIFCSPLOWO2_01_FULL_59_12]|nr:MAG: hypothetical protein A2992_09300 [Elusimicrobia bacterium RIFCSPLOWO2_01_FULL_59_12]